MINNYFWSINTTSTSAAPGATFGRIVSVGSSGTLKRVCTSDDGGLTWANRTTPTSNAFYGIDYSPQLGLFVAASTNGSTSNSVMTSPTGITWSSRTTPTTGYKSVTWIPELSMFLIGRILGGIDYSTDGISWSALGDSVTKLATLSCGKIVYSPTLGIIVASIENNANTAWSEDGGTTWTVATHTTTSGTKSRGGCWSPTLGLFVFPSASSATSNQVITSADGKTFATSSNITPPISNAVNTNVEWVPTLNKFISSWLSTGSFTEPISYSTDGTSYTACSATISTVYKTSHVKWCDGIDKAIAVRQSAIEKSLITTDGITLTPGGQPQIVLQQSAWARGMTAGF